MSYKVYKTESKATPYEVRWGGKMYSLKVHCLCGNRHDAKKSRIR